MDHSPSVAGITIGAILSVVLVAISSGETTEEILAKWKERESTSTTVEARIEEEYQILKPLSSTTPADEEAEPRFAKRKRTLLLKEAKMHHQRTGQSHSVEPPRPEELISTFDGEQARSLQTVGTNRTGFYHTNPYHADRWNMHLLPIVGYFRPLTPEFSLFAPDKWKVVATDMKIGGSDCVMLREGELTDNRYREIWLAKDKDFGLVYRRDMLEGRVASEISIAYRDDIKDGWVPTTWQVDRYSNGRLIDHAVSRLVCLTINEPVEDAKFLIEFPAGTEINGVPPMPREKKP